MPRDFDKENIENREEPVVIRMTLGAFSANFEIFSIVSTICPAKVPNVSLTMSSGGDDVPFGSRLVGVWC